MRVSEIMTRGVLTIAQTDALREARQKMDEHHCRHLAVVDESGVLVGIVSDRDVRLAMYSPFIMRERWQDEAVLDETRIEAIMSPAPVTVSLEATVVDAARLMLSHRISALLVTDNSHLLGILTTTDLLEALIEMQSVRD